MKKTGIYLLYGGALFFAIVLIIIFGSDKKTDLKNASVNTQSISAKKNPAEDVKPAEKIQLYLFHSTNRCYSCITAGEYAKKTLEQNFSQELKSGKIEFKEINVDLAENKEVANKFKAAGTSLFTNSIIDGTDNIKEDTQIWRLVSNEQAFSKYLSEKLKKLMGSEASAQETENVEKEDIVFYFGSDCPECENVEKYLQEKDIRNKISFEEKNINKNEEDANQMAEDAMYCNLDEESFGVPFLWADGKCYAGEKDITDLFNEKINGIS
ncbi:MAG: hypothetical protein UR66_C0004G0056 [Candidatus Moranbacteria bacterium GW2011_GWE1_35_17]|nr:MAG: hypothetical protein UR66_C0004G0056 [Candidatus Moranbacteria bacterium GW2011_GWE1_35_17]KKP84091.1 MAG: hypothetical protein UR82_C0013G0018 [Candidatus Moranbacteria bacterium GW2011_GWF1_35_5]KKP85027.1 MAG: hypothetical protein UR83_C0006G0029 [Candidatus Moranbacteria bacterium GW2011_GWF2_35_54]